MEAIKVKFSFSKLICGHEIKATEFLKVLPSGTVQQVKKIKGNDGKKTKGNFQEDLCVCLVVLVSSARKGGM